MINSRLNAVSMAEHGLLKALERNKEATAAVEGVAEELTVIHSVLITELRAVEAESDLSNAVARTQTLEQTLSESVGKMDAVNRALAEQHGSMKHLLDAK
jgi:hypothetical protein